MNARPRRAGCMDEYLSVQPLPPEVLIEQGKTSFAQGDYTAAIRAWRRASAMLPHDDALRHRLERATGEAFFRRALSAAQDSIYDLVEALRLAPDDPRYQYHLALAYHRRNVWQSAIPLYRALLERTPPYARAAFPLAVALVETGCRPQEDMVWQFLSPEEQGYLSEAFALLRGRRRVNVHPASHQGADALWAGLAAVRSKRPEAKTFLTAALQDATLPLCAIGTAHYYIGVLAWKRGRYTEALEHWQAATGVGMQTPWLTRNLAWACAQSAITLLNSNEALPLETQDKASGLSEALQLAEQGLRYAPDIEELNLIANHVRQHLGYRAALEGDWDKAWKYLWAAYQAGQRGRTLMTNAALAAEALGHFAHAAELWQQIVRSRPRKAPSRAHDVLSDEQVARLWQRAAQCFSRAGNYEDAVRAYRNALRYAPGDVTLQLEWVAAMVKDGRYSAAHSAVMKILMEHPEHEEALAWQAQILDQMGYPYAALHSWQRVLAVHPEHPTARQHIARLDCQIGDYHLEKGNLRRALLAYRDGLEQMPGDTRLRASLARCYGLLGDTIRAQEEAERVLAEHPEDLEAYYWLILTWLSLGKEESAREYLRRAEMVHPPPPLSFYLQLGKWCAKTGHHQWASQLLEIARQRAATDARGLVDLARAFYAMKQFGPAVKCLEQALSLAPDIAEAHLLLGIHLLSDPKAGQRARKHLLQAERLARQKRDTATMAQARVALEALRMGEIE